ncbi:hypothetical protein [Marinobacter sp. S6332]|uniref:hypothetical protein n=1 Tax=Marinobacter sp. S6332 TaxID=2926403 RepID=UPI001FF2A8E5|nr:hypothetical protein [Marinobacter sp. S6332]MCK0163147.1 hypothetical protein [Marinobacter sp. S6332]
MIKNAGMVRKIGLCVAIGGLALGAGVASAETFNATALVENTLAITKVQDLDFGTMFAASANDQAVAGLVLAPDGNVTSATALVVDGASAISDAPKLLSLGGSAAARGSVSVGQGFTLQLPDKTSAALATGSAFVPGEGIALTVNSDPSEAAFYLVDFTVGDVVGGTETDAGSGAWTVTKDFGATEVEFGIGASIYTDGAGTPRTSYQAATYSGTFDVTASY